MSDPTAADLFRGDVLHIRSTPLPRTQREGLLALGVAIETMSPADLKEALEDIGRREEMGRRIREASVCVLDEGTGLRLGTTILNLRKAGQGRTYTTLESLRDVADGIALESTLSGGPPGQCELLLGQGVLRTLRGLAGQDNTTHSAVTARADGAPITRPARPMPYLGDPRVYSIMELPPTVGWERARIEGGRVEPKDLLTLETMKDIDVQIALIFLMRHLPTEDLGLLASPEAHTLWMRLHAYLTARLPMGRGDWTEWAEQRDAAMSVLWHAMARDGGRQTLAALPDEFRAALDIVRDELPRAIDELERRHPLELMSAKVCGQMVVGLGARGVKHLKTWDLIPCEDPLAPEADPNLFRPTITTLRVARRYRSAPEVVLEAYAKWGGRPYLNREAALQIQEFVKESPPTSADEIAGWVRLLHSLPENGQLRTRVVFGARDWPRVDMDIMNLFPEPMWEASDIPCVDEHGTLKEDVLARCGDAERVETIRRVVQYKFGFGLGNRQGAQRTVW